MLAASGITDIECRIPKIRATAAPFELMLAMSNVQCSVGQESSTASSSGSQEQLLGSISALLEELKPKLCREVDVACANSISLDSVNRCVSPSSFA